MHYQLFAVDNAAGESRPDLLLCPLYFIAWFSYVRNTQKQFTTHFLYSTSFFSAGPHYYSVQTCKSARWAISLQIVIRPSLFPSLHYFLSCTIIFCIFQQILIALQKQQLAAARANTSNPYPVTPEEHAEQVQLLSNLQNENILKQLLVNPQFASTLYQAQLQAVQQKEAAQRAHQKAQQEREIAARRAEQMRVEELARKRIAQEDAEKAAREAAMRPVPTSAVIPQEAVAQKEEVSKASEAAAGLVLSDSEERVETHVEVSSITFGTNKSNQFHLQTAPTQVTTALSEVDSATPVTAVVSEPEARVTNAPEGSDPLAVTVEPPKLSSELSTGSAPRMARSMSVTEDTPRLPRARLGSDSALVKRSRSQWKQERQSNPSRSRSPIEQIAIAELDETAGDSTVLAGNVTQIVDTTIPDEDNVFGADVSISRTLDDTAGVNIDEMDVDGELMITHYSEKTIDLNDTQKTFMSAYSDYQKTIAEMREDETNREILEYASRYHESVMFPNGKPPVKELRNNMDIVEVDDDDDEDDNDDDDDQDDDDQDDDDDQNDDEQRMSEPKEIEEKVATIEEDDDGDENPTVEDIEAVINKEEEEIRQKTEQLEIAKKFLRQRQGLESDSESETGRRSSRNFQINRFSFRIRE